MNAVEIYIDEIEDEQIKSIMEGLHHLILATIPQVQASIKWKIPCYKYHKNLCYLNPQKDHVDLGFVQGLLLSNEQGILVKEDRKQIMHINVYSSDEIYQGAIQEVLLEAALINETIAKEK